MQLRSGRLGEQYRLNKLALSSSGATLPTEAGQGSPSGVTLEEEFDPELSMATTDDTAALLQQLIRNMNDNTSFIIQEALKPPFKLEVKNLDVNASPEQTHEWMMS
eukprot:Blabericola_migrator_1__3417@NODE_2004_length_3436_cov_22_345800_g1273_i0_p4_GENE_NODE_2004_length_3436_cov_22_345800_g1273_i0NODE_2004_length_3436_cov_22_345800_g1273_i0_p4_ORF_typecomplete_len106_score18_13GSK3_bind/PF05350_12/0_058_NODE_2004_length_3436_cov_22_345800_g1273_i0565882